MDRLTEWRNGHGACVKGDAYTKLARYEDTGLEPEEVERLKTELKAAIPGTGWRSVKKYGLPEEGKLVFIRYYKTGPYAERLGFDNGPSYAMSIRSDFSYWRGLGREIEVTDWIPAERTEEDE